MVPPTVRRWVRRFDPGYQSMTDQLRVRDERIGKLENRISQLQEDLRKATLSNPETLESVMDVDFLASRISPTRKHLWDVAAPKSGSTWLSAILSHLLGWYTNWLFIDPERREQEIDFRTMVSHPDEDMFSIQQHCRFSKTVQEFVKKFRVRPIVQGRDIFDSLVSFRDHLANAGQLVALAYCDETFTSLPIERQMDFVVDRIAPWYISFYSSWFAARDRGEVTFLWVSYEELRSDPAATVRRILDYIDVPRTDEEVECALKKAAGGFTRLNVAKVGRGKALLSEGQMQRVRDLGSFLPHIDLSSIGL
jgi:hypothetical protein